jgi:hypothetical protein
VVVVEEEEEEEEDFHSTMSDVKWLRSDKMWSDKMSVPWRRMCNRCVSYAEQYQCFLVNLASPTL